MTNRLGTPPGGGAKINPWVACRGGDSSGLPKCAGLGISPGAYMGNRFGSGVTVGKGVTVGSGTVGKGIGKGVGNVPGTIVGIGPRYCGRMGA